jgi:hypothetical protein
MGRFYLVAVRAALHAAKASDGGCARVAGTFGAGLRLSTSSRRKLTLSFSGLRTGAGMAINLKKISRGIYEFTTDWEAFRRDAPKGGADLRPLTKAGLLTQSLKGLADAIQQFDAKYLLLQKLMEEIKRNDKPTYRNEASKLGGDLKTRSVQLLNTAKDAARLLKEVDRGLLGIINQHYAAKTANGKQIAETLRVGYQRVLGPLRALLEQSEEEFTRISSELAQNLVDLERAPAPKLDEDHILCPHCQRALSINEARKKMQARRA